MSLWISSVKKLDYFILEKRSFPRIKNKRKIPFEKRLLMHCTVRKIYFLDKGHNAWHGVWAKKYVPGNSFFTTFNEAVSAAEGQRKQGYVFYVEELPALILTMEDNIQMVVTQINSNAPLENLQIEVIKQRYKNYRDKLYGRDLLSIFEGAFELYSLFWKWPLPEEDSLISVFTIGNIDFEALGRKTLKVYSSKSNGPHYYLDWSEKDANITKKTTRSASRCFQGLLRQKAGG